MTARSNRSAELIALLRTGLAVALERGEPAESGRPGLDANFIGVSAAAIALARPGARDAAPDLLAAFAKVSHGGVHYELRQSSGALAIALAILGADALGVVEPALAECDRIWAARIEFVNQLRYATWILRRDVAGALAWATAHEHGRAYAAAALADLDAKATVPDLEALLNGLEHRASRRAVTYALRHLRGEPHDGRMIWGLALWHANEPAAEFPRLYRTLLDADE